MLEIFRLKQMLEEVNIPFEWKDDVFKIKEKGLVGHFGFERMYPAYQIVIYRDDERLCDAIFHYGSYGRDDGLLEIMGGLTKEEEENDNVLGYLTAEEVFKRFKYCYENNTSVYVKE